MFANHSETQTLYYERERHYFRICIYAYFFSFNFDCYIWLLGAKPQILTGALHLDPDRCLPSHIPFPFNILLATPLKRVSPSTSL